MQRNSLILEVLPQEEYELLDSGEGEKLERYGPFLVGRPDPQALWGKRLPNKKWEEVDFLFEGENKGRIGDRDGWKIKKGAPSEWQIKYGGLTFSLKPTAFKHIGLFPEQIRNWEWLCAAVEGAKRPVSALNLFGYTGGATLALAKAGAGVVHVDASKSAVAWASKNAEISGLNNREIRWIVDDALSFVKREIKRGKRYDGIVMDPPSFGHGPKGELWKIEEGFLNLFNACQELFSSAPLFFLINGYAAGYSPLAYHNVLLDAKEKFGGEVESGELALKEDGSGRVLPAGIFSRWCSSIVKEIS